MGTNQFETRVGGDGRGTGLVSNRPALNHSSFSGGESLNLRFIVHFFVRPSSLFYYFSSRRMVLFAMMGYMKVT